MGIFKTAQNYITDPREFSMSRWGHDWTITEVEHYGDTREIPDYRFSGINGQPSARVSQAMIDRGLIEDPSKTGAQNHIETVLKLSQLAIHE